LQLDKAEVSASLQAAAQKRLAAQSEELEAELRLKDQEFHLRIAEMQQHAQDSQEEALKADRDLELLLEEMRSDNSVEAKQRLEAARNAAQELHDKADNETKVCIGGLYYEGGQALT